jgi:O-acetyl-ADP-ribose deacetylase (regulator of RNase III)
MIRAATGNLLDAPADALVNTVNCEGVMGKGVALQFKRAFPENFKAYARACKAGEVAPGSMFTVHNAGTVTPRFIINFPTKRSWRQPSRYEDIESGLKALVTELQRLGVKTVAVPPLGCGNGGLDWNRVRPMIEHALGNLPDLTVLLYAPTGAPPAAQMTVATPRPRLTRGRALLIQLMHRYLDQDYTLTLLEVQKLAYFLQEAGEPLRLKYSKHVYGPYAPNLSKVLEHMEGHYTRGLGADENPKQELTLMPGAAEQAEEFLRGDTDAQQRLEAVSRVIRGFETPYSMELLSTADWTLKHLVPADANDDDVVQAVHGWNERKRKLLEPAHIAVAARHLRLQRFRPGEASSAA